MPRLLHRIWQFLGRRPRGYLALALLVEVAAAVLLAHGHPLDVAFRQFDLGARQLESTHRIESTFLPIGYSAFYGYLEMLGRHLGRLGGDGLVFAAQVGILLVILLCARAILKRYTSARFATTAALLVALEPALLYDANRITDANATLALLLGFLLCVLVLRARPTAACACVCGLVLGVAVLVRPNFLLMVLLLPAVLPWRRPAQAAGLLAAAALAGLVYAGGTALVHGRPFWPQNGPYNLYAGYNPETAMGLLTRMNGEVSIAPAMADLGLHPTLDWRRPSEQPGVDDIRDERYIPFYRQQTRLFLREHPGQAAWLDVLKLYTFMWPLGANVDDSSGAFQALRSAIKTVTVLVIVAWMGMLIYSRIRHLALAVPIIVWTAVLYVLPFVLINADPRFRTSLEGLVCVDLARMLYMRRRQRVIA